MTLVIVTADFSKKIFSFDRNITVHETKKSFELKISITTGNKDPRNFESVAQSLKKQEKDNNCLKIRGLVKKFGDKTAVSNVNLTMYQG